MNKIATRIKISVSTLVTVLYVASAQLAVAQIQIIGSDSSVGGGDANSLQNPLQFSSITDFIAGALRVMVMVSLPVITLFIVYAGSQFILARGNQGKLTEAKTNFMYVILGALLILGAWVIATMIGGTITQLTTN